MVQTKFTVVRVGARIIRSTVRLIMGVSVGLRFDTFAVENDRAVFVVNNCQLMAVSKAEDGRSKNSQLSTQKQLSSASST